MRTAPAGVVTEKAKRPAWLDGAIIAALVVAGALLRDGPLAPSSLWLDDAWAALVYRAEGVRESLLATVTAPGFSLSLKGLLALTGFSELKAQLIPFLAGVAAAPTAYLIGIRRGMVRAAALLTAGLLLVAPAHMIYSTRVKQYTVDALIVIALLGLAWAVLDDPRRRSGWVRLTGWAIVGTAVSGAVAPVVAAAFAALLVAVVRGARPTLRLWALAAAAYGAFAVAWWRLVLAPALTEGLRSYWSFAYLPVDAGLGRAMGKLVEGLAGVAEAFSAAPAVVTLAAFGAAIVVVAWRRPALAVLFGLPLLAAVALAALRLAPLGGGRTDVYLFPTFAFAIGLAVNPVARRLSTVALTAALAGVGMLIAGAVAYGWGPSGYPAHEVAPLVEVLEGQRNPGDRVVVYSASRWAYALYTPAPIRLFPDSGEAVGFDVEIEDEDVFVLGFHRTDPENYQPEVVEAVEGRDRVWLLVSHFRDDAAALDGFLSRLGFEIHERNDRRGAYLILWTRASGGD